MVSFKLGDLILYRGRNGTEVAIYAREISSDGKVIEGNVTCDASQVVKVLTPLTRLPGYNPDRPVYAVVRNCCLGPNCSYGHGVDNQVRVIQWISYSKAKIEEVSKKWKEYRAFVVDLSSPDALNGVTASAIEWLKEKIVRPESIHSSES